MASLLRGAREMDVELAQATAVVIGATGSIGSACVELLSPHVGDRARRAKSNALGKTRNGIAPTRCVRAFDIDRRARSGPARRATQKLRELDGTVDAIGLGGIDVYLYAGTKRFALRDRLRLLDAVKITPVVDGSGLKNTLEREAVRFLRDELGVPLRGTNVLMVSALDRFGMAQAFVDAGSDVLFGDFIFALDLDKPVRGLAEFEALAERYLPTRVNYRFKFFTRPVRNKIAHRSRSIPSITRRLKSSPVTFTSCVSSCRIASRGRSS